MPQAKIANRHRAQLALFVVAAIGVTAVPAMAQLVTTPQQRSTANQVAQAGVPLSDLAPNAPERYTIKQGDTLWAISTLYLKGPWRWPELWGMNLNDIRNPHLIYPGQVLVLDKSGGRARLMLANDASTKPTEPELPTVKVSPRTRQESLRDSAIPTIAVRDIEAYLAQPLLVTENELNSAPRIVATQDGRVLLSKGDRAYVRSSNGKPLVAQVLGSTDWRIVRNAVPLRDPETKEVLAYEAEYVGRAEMVRGESSRDVPGKDGKSQTEAIPATIDIKQSLQEARTGDRLMPEPEREFLEFLPRAPAMPTNGRVVAVYGSNVTMAAQNQVVVLNRGAAHGVKRGHVLALLSDGRTERDSTQPVRTADNLKLPDERNGLVMVFKAFDKVSYGLVLTITDELKVGDRFVNPR